MLATVDELKDSILETLQDEFPDEANVDIGEQGQKLRFPNVTNGDTIVGYDRGRVLHHYVHG